MRYRLSKNAENNLLEIWGYSELTRGETQAEKYLKKLEARFFELAADPTLGRLRKELLLEYLSYHEARHIIFYLSQEEGIAIARILHERMDLAERLEYDPGLI